MESNVCPKIRYVILLSSVLALGGTGCTSVSLIDPNDPAAIDGFNQSMTGEKAEITLTNGSGFLGEDLRLTTDSLQWLDRSSAMMLSVRADTVARVLVRNSTFGAFEGFAIGAPLGAAIAVSVPLLISGGKAYSGELGGLGAVVMLGGGGFLGGTIGIIWGLSADHRSVYELLGPGSIPRSIHVRQDTSAGEVPIRHVVASIVESPKVYRVFGALVADTPVVQLRVARDRIWEIPRSFVQDIQPISAENSALSGFESLWIIMRKDHTTIAANTLRSYRDGSLEVEFRHSRTAVNADDIQRLERTDSKSIWQRGNPYALIAGGLAAVTMGLIPGIIAGGSVLMIASSSSSADVYDLSEMTLEKKETVLRYVIEQDRNE